MNDKGDGIMKIDLNCDLRESFGAYKIGMDGEVIPYISSANVACGFHASDPLVMQATVAAAKEHGVAVGAHPGYPDLVGFGRRNMNVTDKELKAMVQYQIGALKAFCDAAGVKMQHVKPHGAMYNMAGKNLHMAEAICEGIYEIDPSLILLGQPGSQMDIAAKKTGLVFAREVFADRAYEEDGALVPRGTEGAVLTDETLAIERVISIVKEHKVKAITGKEIELEADSVCVHGDNAKALEFVKKIRETLQKEGIEIASIAEVVAGK